MLKTRVEDFERRMIVRALTAARWRQRQAARELGVLPTTLNEKMKRLGIPSRPKGADGARHGPADDVPDDRREEFRWSGRLAVGRTLEIVGITGELCAEAARVDEVAILAVAAGPLPGRRDVIIRVQPTRSGMRLVAEREDGLPPDPEVKVDAWVRAPLGVRLVGRVGSGHLESFGVAGRFELRAVDGRAEPLPFAQPRTQEAELHGVARSDASQGDSGNGTGSSDV